MKASSPSAQHVLSKLLLIAMCAGLVNPAQAQRKPAPNLNSNAPVAMNTSSKDDSFNFVNAKNPNVMDLIKLFQESAQYDPAYLSAKTAYIAGKESYWQAFSVLLPQITATYSTAHTDLRYDPNLPKFDYGYSASGYNFQLTQPLFNWAAFEKYKQGDLLTGVAENTFAQAQQDLIVRVSQAYFDALTSQDILNLYQNKKGLIAQQLEQAKRNFEVGTATIVDTNEAQSRYDLVTAQIIAAQSDLIVKKSALEQIVGQPIEAIMPLAKQAKIEQVVEGRKVKYLKNSKGELADKAIMEALHLPSGQSMEDWARQAEDVNYNVIVSRLNSEIAKSNYNSARASRLPTVNLVGSTGYNNSLGSLTTAAPNTYYANQIGLQLSVPIFTGGYISSTIRQNAALYDQSVANLDLVKKTNATATKQAYLGFNSGLSQIKAYEAAEKSALSSLQSNKLGYEVGVRINIDVLNAQDQLITTQQSLYKSRYDTIMNGLKLKSLAAVLTDEDLISVNALLH
jgi:outer membrane protein